MATNTTAPARTFQCDWINDDMDGDQFTAPVWCGYYGEAREVTETHWTCDECGTEREVEDE